MSHTFEELVLREIDSLYHGALFLSGGDPAEAESLLVRAVGSAFHAEIGTAAGSQHWLEERLVHTFVTNRSASGSTLPPVTGPNVQAPPVLSSGQLCAAAHDVPPVARAALWLVLLRRWPHQRAREALRIDQGELRVLLQYRHALVADLLADHGAGAGTDRHVVT